MALFSAGIAALTAITSSIAAAGTAAATGIAAASAGGAGLATGGLAAGGITALGGASGVAAGASAGGLGAISTALGVAGTAANIGGGVVGAINDKKAVAAQQQAEALRARQMRLEAARARREVIRNSQITRAIGLNAQAGGGAEVAGSSAYGGLVGQSTTNQNYDVRSINQNEQIGEGLFQANIAQTSAQSQAGFARGVGGIGGTIAENNQQIARIGTSLRRPRTSLFG